MSTVDKVCRYGDLAATLAAVSGQALDEPQPACDEPPAFYVSVVRGDSGLVVEVTTDLCHAHDVEVRAVAGHSFSKYRRPRTT